MPAKKKSAPTKKPKKAKPVKRVARKAAPDNTIQTLLAEINAKQSILEAEAAVIEAKRADHPFRDVYHESVYRYDPHTDIETGLDPGVPAPDPSIPTDSKGNPDPDYGGSGNGGIRPHFRPGPRGVNGGQSVRVDPRDMSRYGSWHQADESSSGSGWYQTVDGWVEEGKRDFIGAGWEFLFP